MEMEGSKMKKALIITIVLFCIMLNASNKTGSIFGKITDINSKLPIPSVNISIDNQNLGTSD